MRVCSSYNAEIWRILHHEPLLWAFLLFGHHHYLDRLKDFLGITNIYTYPQEQEGFGLVALHSVFHLLLEIHVSSCINYFISHYFLFSSSKWKSVREAHMILSHTPLLLSSLIPELTAFSGSAIPLLPAEGFAAGWRTSSCSLYSNLIFCFICCLLALTPSLPAIQWSENAGHWFCQSFFLLHLPWVACGSSSFLDRSLCSSGCVYKCDTSPLSCITDKPSQW